MTNTKTNTKTNTEAQATKAQATKAQAQAQATEAQATNNRLLNSTISFVLELEGIKGKKMTRLFTHLMSLDNAFWQDFADNLKASRTRIADELKDTLGAPTCRVYQSVYTKISENFMRCQALGSYDGIQSIGGLSAWLNAKLGIDAKKGTKKAAIKAEDKVALEAKASLEQAEKTIKELQEVAKNSIKLGLALSNVLSQAIATVNEEDIIAALQALIATKKPAAKKPAATPQLPPIMEFDNYDL